MSYYSPTTNTAKGHRRSESSLLETKQVIGPKLQNITTVYPSLETIARKTPVPTNETKSGAARALGICLSVARAP
jgi:hypothetical protein